MDNNRELYERLAERVATSALIASATGQHAFTRDLASKLINSSYDDVPVEHILTDICLQAGFHAICPKSDLKLYNVPIVMQSANQAIDNVCRMVGWYWRYDSTDHNTIIFAVIADTIREHVEAAEKALRAACDSIDVVSALDEPTRRDGWYGARYMAEAALGRFVHVMYEADGNDLIGRLFKQWTGDVPQ